MDLNDIIEMRMARVSEFDQTDIVGKHQLHNPFHAIELTVHYECTNMVPPPHHPNYMVALSSLRVRLDLITLWYEI